MFSYLPPSAHQPSSTRKITWMTAQGPAAREINQMCTTQQASCDREFARALKVFYQSMNVARGQFLKLRHYKPPVSTQHPRSQRIIFPLNVALGQNGISRGGWVCAAEEQAKAGNTESAAFRLLPISAPIFHFRVHLVGSSVAPAGLRFLHFTTYRMSQKCMFALLF